MYSIEAFLKKYCQVEGEMEVSNIQIGLEKWVK